MDACTNSNNPNLPTLEMIPQQIASITRPNSFKLRNGCKFTSAAGSCVFELHHNGFGLACSDCPAKKVLEYYQCKIHKAVMCCVCKDKAQKEETRETQKDSDPEYRPHQRKLTNKRRTTRKSNQQSGDEAAQKAKPKKARQRNRTFDDKQNEPPPKRRKRNENVHDYGDENDIYLALVHVKKAMQKKELMTERINNLQKHNKRAVSQAARRTKEVNALQGQLKEKEKDILQKEKSIHCLSGTCDAIKAEKCALEMEIIGLQNKNKIVETVKKKLDQQVKKNGELLLKFNKKVTELQYKNKILDAEMNKNAALQSRFDENVQEVASLRQQDVASKKEIQSHHDEKRKLKKLYGSSYGEFHKQLQSFLQI